MSILLDTQTADYDLADSATILWHNMVAAGDVRVVVRVGTGAKPCVALAGVWELFFYVNVGGTGYNIEPATQQILTSDSTLKLFFSKVVDVPAGAYVGLRLTSPNIGDSDVTVTAEIWHVSGSLPAVVAGAVGGLPVLNADGYVEADAKAVRAQALGAKAGLNFNTLFQDGGRTSSLTLTFAPGGTGIATEAKQDTAALTAKYARAFASGRVTIANGVWTYYDTDGTTPLFTLTPSATGRTVT